MALARLLPLTLVLAAACGGTQLDPGFESELTTTAGCDGFFYATSDDDSLLLVFRPGSPLADIAAGPSGSVFYDFGEGTVAVLYVEKGTGLGAGFCSDTVTGNTEVRYHALDGEADFIATDAASGGYDVILRIRSLLFGEELGDHRVFVEALELTGHMD